MSTNYCLPFIFEDKTGRIRGSEFDEVHDRMRLWIRCTRRDPSRMAYMIHEARNTTEGVCLSFGPNNALGTICIGSKGEHLRMDKYLSKLSALGSSKVRQFRASDGQLYTWSWRSVDGNEWTCVNANKYLVSSYAHKPPKEPVYSNSSGSSFTIDESYPHIAVELLATLTIMRHIVEHNL